MAESGETIMMGSAKERAYFKKNAADFGRIMSDDVHEDGIILGEDEVDVTDSKDSAPDQKVIRETPKLCAARIQEFRTSLEQVHKQSLEELDIPEAKPGWFSSKPDEGYLTREVRDKSSKYFKNGADVPDAKLLRFLRCRKYEVERAHATMVKHAEVEDTYNLQHVEMHRIRHLVKMGMMTLPTGCRDNRGRQVIIMLGDLEKMIGIEDDEWVAFTWWLIENAMKDADVQRKGLIILMSLHGLSISFGLMWKLEMQLGHLDALVFDIMMTAQGTRMAGMFMLDTPWWFTFIWRIVVIFLSKKLRARVHLWNGEDAKQLYDYIPVERMPTWLGGLDGTLEWDKDAWAREVLGDIYEEVEKEESEKEGGAAKEEEKEPKEEEKEEAKEEEKEEPKEEEKEEAKEEEKEPKEEEKEEAKEEEKEEAKEEEKEAKKEEKEEAKEEEKEEPKEEPKEEEK